MNAPRLTPPATKPVRSVARVTADWYVAAASSELGRRPKAVTILGVPLVLFRDGRGRAAALLDRCPHRNVPLSLGKVRRGELQCAYHGWRFAGDGRCTAVPGLDTERDTRSAEGRCAPAFPCREQDGYVWVWPEAMETPGATPDRNPFPFPHLDDPRYATVRADLPMEGSLHATAENALDVPHTAFLHAGLFRSDAGARRPIEVIVRRWHDRVEAEYVGEPRPSGLFGRLLAPSGGVVEHWDRFILPCIAQVEYRIGEDAHVVATTALTPVHDDLTHLWGAVSLRMSFLPDGRVAEIAGNLLKPLALRILKQDADMLREQTRNVLRFGGERFTSTEIDVLGPHILRLLRQAERGRAAERAEPEEQRLIMRVG
ncbi:MAG: aromatic ring-hydroxylating dioxygenase subunit alpha [Myxococcota bacterium]